MNSSASRGRLVRAARDDEDVFVLGTSRMLTPAAPGAITTAGDLVAAAERRAAAIIDAAEAEARGILAEAQDTAGTVRSEAVQSGTELARGEVFARFEAHLDLIRQAAEQGQAIRDSVASQSAALIARAVALATRRIVGEYYNADPARTAAACAEALRAASGQEIVMIRVNPAIAGHVQATLADAGRYVRPDDGVEIGGCIVDLKNGTIDATLDARLSLMEQALGQAGGEVA